MEYCVANACSSDDGDANEHFTICPSSFQRHLSEFHINQITPKQSPANRNHSKAVK
jgi:hypothetical protein